MRGWFVACVTFFVLFDCGVVAQIPCDDACGQYCPESSGYDVGVCLKELDPEINPLPQQCKSFIDLHDVCKEDIDQHCTGKEYTTDIIRKFSPAQL
jgi:hypothetical protein